MTISQTNRNMCWLSAAIFCFICLLFSPKTQAFKYQFQTIGTTPEEAISGVTIKRIVQNKQGFIWIATTSGLNRYDGIRNQQFLESDPLFKISDNYIRDLTTDSQGNIWLLNRKSVEYSNNNLHFKQIINLAKHFDINEISSIQHLKIAKNGDIWLKSSNALYVFDSLGRIKSRILLPKAQRTAKNWSIAEFFLSPNKVWVLTNKGLWYYDFNRENWFQEKSWSNQLKNEVAYTHLIINQDTVAITTDTAISIISVSSLKEDAIYSNQELNIQTPVLQLVKNSRQEYWAASTSGLYELSPNWEPISHYTYASQLNIKSPTTNTLYFDEEDNLWVGSAYNGVRVLWDIAQAFNVPEMLINENISGLATFDEKLLIGTYLGQMFEYTPRNNQMSQVDLQLNNFVKVNPPINEILPTRRRYWVATAQGLFIYDKDTEQTQQWLVGLVPNFPFISIMDIHQDKNGDIWVVGERGGVIKVNPKTLDFYNLTQKEQWKADYSNLTFNSIISDDENIFFGTSEGIILAYHLQNQSFERHEPQSSNQKGIFQMRKDQKNNLWMITGYGALLYNPNERTTLTEISASDFKQTAFYSLSFDDKNNIWLAGNSAISKYNTLNGEKVRYNNMQGALSQELNQASVKLNNKLYFGSVSGLLEISPDHLEQQNNQQTIYYDEIHRHTTHSHLVDKLVIKDLNTLSLKENESFSIPLRPQIIATKDQYEIGISIDNSPVTQIDDWLIKLPSYQYSVGQHEIKVLLRKQFKKSWSEAFIIQLDRQGSFWEYISFKLALLLFFTALVIFGLAYFRQTQKRFNRELSANVASLTEQQTHALIKYNKLAEHSYYLLEDIIRTSQTTPVNNQSNYEEIRMLCDSLIRFGYQLVNGRINMIKSNLNILIDNNLKKYFGINNNEIEINFQNEVKITNEVYVELILIYLKTCFMLVKVSSSNKVNLLLSRVSARRVNLKLTMINRAEISFNDLIPNQYTELLKFLCKEAGYNCEIVSRRSLIELTLTLPVVQKWRGLFIAKEQPLEIVFSDNREASSTQKIQPENENAPVIVLSLSKQLFSQMNTEIAKDFQLSYFNSFDIESLQPNKKTILVIELFNADDNFFQEIETYRKQRYFKYAIILCPPVLIDYYEEQSENNSHYIFQSAPMVTDNIWKLILFLNKKRDFENLDYIKNVNQEASATELTNEQVKQKSNFVEQLDNFLEKAHQNSHLNVEKIAESMFLSKSQFTRKLRQATTLSPAEYLKLYRLQKAVALLDEKISVKDTAKITGFASQSYFATCFKKQFGYSPSQHPKEE